MLSHLFDQIGFRATLRFMALMMAVMLGVANLLVTSVLPSKGFAGRRSLLNLAMFKNPTYILFVSGSFLFFWGLFGPFDYLPLFGLQDASTAPLAAYTVSILKWVQLSGLSGEQSSLLTSSV
jgi:hypothetical protein